MSHQPRLLFFGHHKCATGWIDVLARCEFEKLRGGRRRGTIVADSNYRSGQPSDWRRHFTPSLTAEFDRRHRRLLERYGNLDETWFALVETGS